jgi:hypothetical protein
MVTLLALDVQESDTIVYGYVQNWGETFGRIRIQRYFSSKGEDTLKRIWQRLSQITIV